MSEALRAAARRIFAEALRAVDVRKAVRASLSVSDETVKLDEWSVPRSDVDEVLIVAMGKAAVPMYQAAAERLDGVPTRALVIGPGETLPKPTVRGGTARFLTGAHPTPTLDSLSAADAVLEMLHSATERTAVLFLVSGGASAMVERPLSEAVSLEDLAAFSRALVGSGMGITEMNTLRKHLSAVKGGRLAVAAAKARAQCTLLVSDVPAASPDAIASGPSLPDGTTVADAQRLYRLLQGSRAMPGSVAAWFESAELCETPRANDSAFARSHWRVILSSEHLAAAAARAAAAEGFYALVDNTPDDWEYRAAGAYLLRRSRLLAEQHERSCLISVGEVGVALSHPAGEGGRNQQFALWCAEQLAQGAMESVVLSAGSDGIDGHSNAAGAVCDETTTRRAAELNRSTSQALHDFDSTPLLSLLGDTILTGPTGHNLRDLRLCLSHVRSGT